MESALKCNLSIKHEPANVIVVALEHQALLGRAQVSQAVTVRELGTHLYFSRPLVACGNSLSVTGRPLGWKAGQQKVCHSDGQASKLVPRVPSACAGVAHM